MNDFVRLPDLSKHREKDIEGTFQRLSEHLRDFGEEARIQFRIVDPRERRCWCLNLSSKGNNVIAEMIDQPDLEIVTKAETWLEIASGKVSPLDKLLQGKLRFCGDIELGKRVLMYAGASGTRVDPC